MCDLLMGADSFGAVWQQLSPRAGPLALEDASHSVQIAQVYIALQSTLQSAFIFAATGDIRDTITSRNNPPEDNLFR